MGAFLVRAATAADIPAMHRIRMAVRENTIPDGVIGLGDYVEAIETTGRGWVAEDAGEIVGFAVGNARTGNIWALFVDPAHEGRGHGRRLHERMVHWLFELGLERLTLGTDPDTRARAFYEAAGWTFVDVAPNGERRYELRRDRAVRAGKKSPT